jgi:hypothetical protein
MAGHAVRSKSENDAWLLPSQDCHKAINSLFFVLVAQMAVLISKKKKLLHPQLRARLAQLGLANGGRLLGASAGNTCLSTSSHHQRHPYTVGGIFGQRPAGGK